MQDADISYMGQHTWAEIARARKEASDRDGPGSPKGLFIVLALGVVALAFGGWVFY
jgi:hypothetical protein